MFPNVDQFRANQRTPEPVINGHFQGINDENVRRIAEVAATFLIAFVSLIFEHFLFKQTRSFLIMVLQERTVNTFSRNHLKKNVYILKIVHLI